MSREEPGPAAAEAGVEGNGEVPPDAPAEEEL
jgi:hypothetical protein